MNQKDLAGVSVFAGLPEAELAKIAEDSELVTYGPGETIVAEGAISFRFFAIASGEAAAFHQGVQVGELSSGDFFGELGVVPQGGLKFGRRKATVVAKTELQVIEVPGRDLRETPALLEAIQAAAEERADSLK
jgi:CRP-like cAMP-binding protein